MDDMIKILSDNAFKIYVMGKLQHNDYLSVDYLSAHLRKSISTVRRGQKEIRDVMKEKEIK